jgi:uncharacterized protein
MYNLEMIKNSTKKSIVSNDFSTKNVFGKIKGLIGEKEPKTILLKTRFGIHTFFLKFPIDVIILDRDKKVVDLKKQLFPNRCFFWNIKFDTVIELPAGSIEKSRTETGDLFEGFL